MDPLKIVVNALEADRIEILQKAAPALKELWHMNRNVSLVWSALIDRGAKLIATGKESRAHEWLNLMCNQAQLPLDRAVVGDEIALFAAFRREPKIAYFLLRQKEQSWDKLSKEGLSIVELLMLRLKKIPLDDKGLEVLTEHIKNPRFDPSLNDQGVQMLFHLLPSVSIYPNNKNANQKAQDLETRTQWLQALLDRGVDINAPRGSENLQDKVRVNTPLAYMIKRLVQWQDDTGGLGRSDVGFLMNWLDVLLKNGADPSLQLESGARLRLMEVTQRVPALKGFAERLEAQVLEIKSTPNGIKEESSENVLRKKGKRL